MLTPEEIDLLSKVLYSSAPVPGLADNLQVQLLMKGAVLTLEEDASPEAAEVLLRATVHCPLPSVQDQALSSLGDLAANGYDHAGDILHRLVVEFDYTPAREIIEHLRLHATTPQLEAAYFLLTGQMEKYNRLDADLSLITNYFQNAPEPVRQRVLAAARKSGMQNWALLVTSIEKASTASLEQLLQQNPLFDDKERWLALELLRQRASTSERVAEAIAQLFLRHEDMAARDLAVEQGYAPRDSIQKALFFFLTEQWDRYERLDFNHTLIGAAYEAAGPRLRKRILAHSRYTGQLEWLETLTGSSRPRWLSELDERDWEMALQRLQAAEKWEELWRLAQAAPPVWSARMITALAELGWMAESGEDQEFFKIVSSLMRELQDLPLQLKKPQRLENPAGDILALSISPDGKLLAAGGTGSAIQLWQLPSGDRLPNQVIPPVSLTRALVFTSHGGYLTTVNGDDQIRIFRLPEGKVIKTMSGHQNVVRAIQLDRDERTLFSAGFDGALIAWRFPIGTKLQKIEQNDLEIYALALSPSGDMVLSAGADQQIRVWKWPEGKLIREIQAHNGTVTALAASSTGQVVASYGADRTIRIWNYVSGKLLSEIPTAEFGTLTALAVHPNEQVVIAGSDLGEVMFWSLSTGKLLPPKQLKEHNARVTALIFSPTGETLISAGFDGTICLWNLETFLLIRLPVESMRPDMIRSIQDRLVYSGLSRAEQAWLRYTHELVRWRQRFDVQIDTTAPIQIGEFDILL